MLDLPLSPLGCVLRLLPLLSRFRQTGPCTTTTTTPARLTQTSGLQKVWLLSKSSFSTLRRHSVAGVVVVGSRKHDAEFFEGDDDVDRAPEPASAGPQAPGARPASTLLAGTAAAAAVAAPLPAAPPAAAPATAAVNALVQESPLPAFIPVPAAAAVQTLEFGSSTTAPYAATFDAGAAGVIGPAVIEEDVNTDGQGSHGVAGDPSGAEAEPVDTDMS